MRLLIGSLVLILLAGFASAQSADEKKIMTLEEAFEKAIASKDAAALSVMEKHMNDTVVMVEPYGNAMTQTKTDLMAYLQNPQPGVTVKYAQSDYKISVKGNAAVVTYKVMYSASGMKNPALDMTDSPSACMDVFTKQKGEWYGWATACAPSKSIPQAAYDANAEEMKK